MYRQTQAHTFSEFDEFLKKWHTTTNCELYTLAKLCNVKFKTTESILGNI